MEELRNQLRQSPKKRRPSVPIKLPSSVTEIRRISRARTYPTPMPGHVLLGVSRRFLIRFALQVSPNATSADVAKQVREQLKYSGTSMAETLQHPDSGRATVFVSHAQKCSFHQLVKALEQTLETDFIWIDIMCVRQHDIARDLRWISHLVQWAGCVFMVLDPWYDPVCLKRMWCLYELAMCDSSIHLELVLAPSERNDFNNALANTPHLVHHALTKFDAREASTSLPDDRDMIHRAIERRFASGEKDPYDIFNETVRTVLLNALVFTPRTRMRRLNIKTPSPRRLRISPPKKSICECVLNAFGLSR